MRLNFTTIDFNFLLLYHFNEIAEIFAVFVLHLHRTAITFKVNIHLQPQTWLSLNSLDFLRQGIPSVNMSFLLKNAKKAQVEASTATYHANIARALMHISKKHDEEKNSLGGFKLHTFNEHFEVLRSKTLFNFNFIIFLCLRIKKTLLLKTCNKWQLARVVQPGRVGGEKKFLNVRLVAQKKILLVNIVTSVFSQEHLMESLFALKSFI